MCSHSSALPLHHLFSIIKKNNLELYIAVVQSRVWVQPPVKEGGGEGFGEKMMNLGHILPKKKERKKKRLGEGRN